MFLNKTSLRISLFGGSTDHPNFIKKFRKSLVINFSANLYTYSLLFRDKFGFNSINDQYIINYSRREQTKKVEDLKNDIVREALRLHKLPPLSIYLTSDIFSSGSGLGSSSSYILSILKSIYQFKNAKVTDLHLAKEALQIERNFNRYCGYQDPFGCAIKGLKIIKTNNDKDYKILKINSQIFKNFNFYLYPTNIFRKSSNILKKLSQKMDSLYPLYEVALEAENFLIEGDVQRFFELMRVSWDLKKKTSKLIMNNKALRHIDNLLETTDEIIAHKLLGAGSGGFFLIVTNKKNSLNFSKNFYEIKIHEE